MSEARSQETVQEASHIASPDMVAAVGTINDMNIQIATAAEEHTRSPGISRTWWPSSGSSASDRRRPGSSTPPRSPGRHGDNAASTRLPASVTITFLPSGRISRRQIWGSHRMWENPFIRSFHSPNPANGSL